MFSATAAILGSANSTAAKRFMVPSLHGSDAVPTGNRVGGPFLVGAGPAGERLILNFVRDRNVTPA